MKALKIILIFCFVWLFGKAQNNFDNYYKTGYENVRSSDPISNSDSSVVILNYIIDSATGRQDAGFLKLNKLGNIVVQNSFNLFNRDHAGFIYMKSFIEATACSFFLAGSTTYNSKAAVVLCKINKNTLDTMKVRIYKDPLTYYSMNNLIKFNSNKYYLIGNASTSSTFSPVILQLDSNLAITNTINLSNAPANFQCRNVIWNPINKKFLFEGSILEGQRPIALFHADTLGIVTNSSTSISSFTTSLGQVFLSNFDTSYVCTGARKDSIYGNFGLNKLIVCKFDKNLNMLWLKTYGEEALYNGLLDAVILNDGSIVCSGSYSKLTSLPMNNLDQNGVILKVDRDGHYKWMREYNHHAAGNYWESFYGITETKEGGFVACGNVVNMPQAKAWVIKTDSAGCVIPGCLSSIVSVDSIAVPPPPDTSTVGFKEQERPELKWLVYPNPANSQLNVTLEKKANTTQMTLHFYTIYGVEVKYCSIEENNHIDISELKGGLYILQLYDSNQLISTKKLEVVR